jgi:hypothetical protein
MVVFLIFATDRLTDRLTENRVNKTDRRTGEQTDGWRDEQPNGQREIQTDRSSFLTKLWVRLVKNSQV